MPPSSPAQPRTTFDFSSATSPGWTTGGGNRAFAFDRTDGRTPSSDTGPSAGVGGSGSYLYAEASSPRAQGDRFTLGYNGSACSAIGVGVSTVAFDYHMYGADMGELRVTNAAGEAVWSLSGDQGNSWQAATVDVLSPSFAFEYTRGSGYRGDAAVAQVAVSCGSAPPPPPPPSPSSPPSLPSSPKPFCAMPIDFALVLDESDSMKNLIDGAGGLKAFAKELVRHAAMKLR